MALTFRSDVAANVSHRGIVSGVMCRCLAAAVCAASLPAAAAGFVGQAYPLPQRVERDHRVRTSLLLQFDIERYGQSFELFAARRLDAFETVFRDFVRALLAGDVASAAALRPGEAPAQARALVAGYHQLFAGPPRLGVVARVAAGDHQIFVWDWPTPDGKRVYQAFAVESASGGGMRVEIVTSDRPLDTLIVDALQQYALDAAAYAPVAPERRHHLAFPLARGGPGAHPVVLHFDGEATDLELTAPETLGAVKVWAGNVGEALRAYLSAWRAFERRDIEAYLGAFTEHSRDKLREAFAAMTPEAFNSYHAQTTAARRLRFVLEASPLVLVYYTRGQERRVYYDYLIGDGQRGYKLTNVGFEDFLDDVLHDESLWPADVDAFRKHVLGVSTPK